MIHGYFRLYFALSILLGCLLVPATWASDQGEERPAPYADLLTRPYEYRGEKRDLPEPSDVSEVRLGVFSPTRGRRGTVGEKMRQGAELAVADANADGGFQGKPFRLILRPDDQLWGSAREVVQLVYAEQVWAVLGTIGGEGTHIAEQVITKAQVPLISPASTDTSLNQINIPWMFRLMPGDEQIASRLGQYLFRERGFRRVVGIAATSYDSRHRMVEFEKVARRSGFPLRLSLKYTPGEQDFTVQIARIEHVEADAIVLWGLAEESARLVQRLRARGLDQPIFGGPGMDSPEFLRLAGDAAERMIVVVLCDLQRDDPVLGRFKRQFEARYRTAPGTIAAYAYDAMNLLIRAVREAGLNRAKIRDALAESTPYHGVTGAIRFDGTGGNPHSPVLVRVDEGQFQSPSDFR